MTSLNTLPSEYRANIRLTPFTNANLNNLDILYHSRIALVCGNPSITSTSEPAQTMFIYSHGSAVTVGKLNIPVSTTIYYTVFRFFFSKFTLNIGIHDHSEIFIKGYKNKFIFIILDLIY